MEWKRKHLLGLEELSREEIELILSSAKFEKNLPAQQTKILR